jgi:PEP-CTERM motif
MRTLFTVRLFAGLLALTPILSQPAWAMVQYYTISDIDLTGLFGIVSGGGSFTMGSSETSSVTVTEMQPGPFNYTYTFTGPLNGAGYTQKSQQPATPCITEGCSPGETFPSTNAGLNVDFLGVTGTVAVDFEDNGEIYTGTGVISGGGTSPPSGGSNTPEPSTWAMLLLGFAGLSFVGYRRRKRLAGA